MRNSRKHSYDRDKSGVEKNARSPSPLSPRITATAGRSITTKQIVGYQPDQGMARFGASETITEAEALQLSSFKIGHPTRAPSTGRGDIIDLEGMVTEFVRAGDTKRSGTGPRVGSGR